MTSSQRQKANKKARSVLDEDLDDVQIKNKVNSEKHGMTTSASREFESYFYRCLREFRRSIKRGFHRPYEN